MVHGMPGVPATPCWSVCSCIAGLHTDSCQGSACMHQRGIRCSSLYTYRMEEVWDLTSQINSCEQSEMHMCSHPTEN